MKYLFISLVFISQLFAMEQDENKKKLITINALRQKNSTFRKNVVKLSYISIDGSLSNAWIELQSQGLDSLEGITTLVYENVTSEINTINLDNNNLQELDVEKLLTLFPKLWRIQAKNNQIKKLILPKKLKDEFQLLLENNQLQKIPYFHCPRNGIFNFSGNQLSQEHIRALEKRLQLSLYQKNKQHLGICADHTIGFIEDFIPSSAKVVFYASPIVVIDCLLQSYGVDPYSLSLAIISLGAVKGLFDGCRGINPHARQWHPKAKPNVLFAENQHSKDDSAG